MLALVPLIEAEFPTFFEAVTRSYADGNVAGGRWSAAEALDLSRAETRRLLPANEKTAEHYLFVLEDSDLESAAVGYLWFGDMTRAGKKVAYLYQLYIHAPLRGQGYGRQALQLFEQAALGRGCDTLALHVFAANERAHRLYQAVGYGASGITMRKELRPDPPAA